MAADPLIEVRAGAPFQASGRTLAGPALIYGDVSTEHAERFEPGAFGPSPAAPMNLQHDPAMEVLPAGGYELADTGRALEVRARLPEDSAAIKLVRRGALSGFSIEFHSRAERREDGIRVVERAELVGIALVDHPSFPGSLAEVRAKGARGGRLGSVRGHIPASRNLECRCGPGNCDAAIFESGALDGALHKDSQREILAVAGEYANVLASRKRGAVRFWSDGKGGLNVAVDIPNTERGAAFLETIDVAPVYARPVIDRSASEFTIADRVARYSRAQIRAVTLGATDADSGWAPLAFYRPGAEPEEREAVAPRRPGLRWL